ncbi:NAD(P)/FAD-dependent oxidoreductase [Natrononativus amylolyticus]|uniref:NAD(P)/FAD-dependent oxidoreductase n=1 Tax=Natrononativus amylolyticus TaxID=2963434 RepID=UPI0020CE6979|nr:FAD-dependent oxidoreductase [Natrononativus amylolyticus]
MNVAVVGGGIIGTALAARLSGTDREVTLLERGDLGAETTAASAGMVLWATTHPAAVDLALRGLARETYDPLLADGTLEATRLGTLYLAESEAYAERLEEAAAALKAHGVDARYRRPGDLAELGVDPSGVAGGLHTADDYGFEPTALVEHFADAARDRGATIRTGTPVTDVVVSGGAVTGVETADGVLEADLVVNAAGPWAIELNEFAGVSLPLCHTLGPMLEVETQAGIETPFTILESRRYVRPVGDGRAYVGEFLTEYVAGQRYGPGERRIPDSFRAAARGMDAVVPALEGATTRDEWIGLRTVTPDGRPLVGETAVPGFAAACGLTGLGITLAPAVADVFVDSLAGRNTDLVAALDPSRF